MESIEPFCGEGDCCGLRLLWRLWLWLWLWLVFDFCCRGTYSSVDPPEQSNRRSRSQMPEERNKSNDQNGRKTTQRSRSVTRWRRDARRITSEANTQRYDYPSWAQRPSAAPQRKHNMQINRLLLRPMTFVYLYGGQRSIRKSLCEVVCRVSAAGKQQWILRLPPRARPINALREVSAPLIPSLWAQNCRTKV